jgi:heterotetrameric sarcosine oxidase delta subunit
MRIQCPFCGERDLSEFAYHGDAGFVRPDPGAADAPARFFAEVYLRNNPAGPHEELWYHVSGCRSWLRVRRDTRTHEILGLVFAQSDLASAASGES